MAIDDESDVAKWDPHAAQRLIDIVRPIGKRWFRWEVRGLERLPAAGGALVVSNHSGGSTSTDVVMFAADFYEQFGYDRPLYSVGHDGLFMGPLADPMTRLGIIRANQENAIKALRTGGLVLTFPGGVYDVYRPTLSANVIDFKGRNGYVKSAIEAGVPIVPTVSIGAQESQLFLSRGTWLAKRLGLTRFRMDTLPISFGFPFGLSVLLPLNLPLPTKITAQVLEPIDIAVQFGDDPDIDEVDAHVRSVMQSALDTLANQRRFPVLG
ncbi:MAG: lysophospholipid acyltransferase family protein [Mycobacterium sp.]